MVMRHNPKYFKLIKDFLDYLERPNEASGYILVDKGNWDNNSMFFRQIPPKGEKTRVKIHFEIRRPKQDELENQIELYLKSREED